MRRAPAMTVVGTELLDLIWRERLQPRADGAESCSKTLRT
jgi:hypothetical protein